MSRLMLMMALLSAVSCASLRGQEVKHDTAFEQRIDLRNIRTDRIR